MNATAGVLDVAKKKGGTFPKGQGTLIRVSDELADALREVAGLELTSIAKFGDVHLLPIVRRYYREAIIKKARRMEGGSP